MEDFFSPKSKSEPSLRVKTVDKLSRDSGRPMYHYTISVIKMLFKQNGSLILYYRTANKRREWLLKLKSVF